MLPALSERLLAVASLVPEQSVLADVGTDHGYVPVWLCKTGKIQSAIATDINRGPLRRAEEHIRQYGMETCIQTRLSDGLKAVNPGEADAVVIAGMGGGLILHILKEGEAVCRQAAAIVLQPQSEIVRVREYLMSQGYVTDAEKMVCEDGKYYPMMRVHSAQKNGASSGHIPDVAIRQIPEENQAETERLMLRYGRLLPERRDPVLFRYLENERDTYQNILAQLNAQRESGEIRRRMEEIDEVLRLNGAARALYGE